MKKKNTKIKLAVFSEKEDFAKTSVLDQIIKNIQKCQRSRIKIYFFLSSKKCSNIKEKENIFISQNLGYFTKTKDHRLYQEFIHFCIKKKINYALIYQLTYPEFLLNDLNYIKNIKTKFILSDQAYTLSNRSEVRAKVMIELLKKKNIKKLFIMTINGEKSNGPNYFEKDLTKFKLDSKIKKMCEWRKFNSTVLNMSESRKKLNIPKKNKVILFFGMPFYGKGLDILIKAHNKLKNISLIIGSNLNKINFKFEYKNLLIKKNNIYLFNKTISEKLKKNLFAACDVVCMPYRKTYLYGSSGVLNESVLWGKYVVLPNFEPFSSFISYYKSLGICFKAENVNDLKKKIVKAFEILKENKANYLISQKKYILDAKNANNWHNEIIKVIKTSGTK
jgi:glycosyltransferase involved in cell wall biosynthesis